MVSDVPLMDPDLCAQRAAGWSTAGSSWLLWSPASVPSGTPPPHPPSGGGASAPSPGKQQSGQLQLPECTAANTVNISGCDLASGWSTWADLRSAINSDPNMAAVSPWLRSQSRSFFSWNLIIYGLFIPLIKCNLGLGWFKIKFQRLFDQTSACQRTKRSSLGLMLKLFIKLNY